MQSTLFIRLLTPATRLAEAYHCHFEWLLTDAAGNNQGPGFVDYEGLRALVGGEGEPPLAATPLNVVALAGNAQVLCLQCEVPGRRPGQIKQALPYVVEEFLAADVEGMHIASAPVKSGMPVRCCVVEKSVLDGWLACLASLNINLQHLVAESELLPSTPRCANVLLDGGAALIRLGGQAAAVERTNLALALDALDMDEIHFINGALTDIERSRIDPDIGVEMGGASQNTISYLAARWQAQAGAINLLQGAFKPAPSQAHGMARWRHAGALAALWLMLGLGALIAQGWWSSMQAEALEAKSLGLYWAIFPHDRTVTAQSLRRRLQSRLGAAAPSAGLSLIDFIGHLAAVIKPSMTVVGMDYNGARGEFNADLLVRRYADVDQTREAFAARALQAEIISAEQTEEGVRTRFRLRAP